MGKLRNIFYLFFTLSFVPTLQAQDSLYFFQYTGQKYLTQNRVERWGGGGGFFTYINTGEVTPYKFHNGKQYFNNPFFNVPMAYFDGKIYWLKTGDIEILLADLTLPSGTSFSGSIPPHINMTLTITKFENTYRIEGGNYILYLKKNFGLNRLYFSDSWGPPLPGSIKTDLTVNELKYPNPDGSYFLYRVPVTVNTSIQFQDTLISPSLKVDITSIHPYSQGYASAIDFWQSATANLIYCKTGQDTITIKYDIPKKYPSNFLSTLAINDSLLLAGYRLKIFFVLTDLGVGPNTFRYPATDGYEIKYIIRTTDFYSKISEFRNYYTKWMISGNDTTYKGIVEHILIGDTVHEMKVYSREELFGEIIYIHTNQNEDLSFIVYKNDSGIFKETAREKHLFSFVDSSPIHYLLLGQKKITLNATFQDTTGGVISKLYHFKGGYRGDEEIKYKARTGPKLIVRYELDSLGVAQKYVYKLWKVNNRGVVYTLDNDAIPNPPVAIPTEFSISNNYPNPFNPSTKVRIATVENSVLTFTLFNSNGEEVSSYTKEYTAKGNYEEEINLSGFPSGAWFLSVRDENGKQIKLLKLLYLK